MAGVSHDQANKAATTIETLVQDGLLTLGELPSGGYVVGINEDHPINQQALQEKAEREQAEQAKQEQGDPDDLRGKEAGDTPGSVFVKATFNPPPPADPAREPPKQTAPADLAAAEADNMTAQAEKLAAVEKEALEQRQSSWGNRIKNIFSSTVGAATGAFTGGVGARAGQEAVDAVFGEDK